MSELSKRDKAILNSIFNPTLPLGEAIYDEALTSDLKDDTTFESLEIKELEIKGILAAESNNFKEAIKIFTTIIELAPLRPSSYNNRAQVYRLAGNNKEALLDIMKAIETSDRKGRSYCQALCQRAILYRKDGRNHEAKKDFLIAAKMGSKFAKAQLIEMNPYAAMCNDMLKKVICDLQKSENAKNK